MLLIVRVLVLFVHAGFVLAHVAAGPPADAAVTSFTSNDATYCAQGAPRAAQAALAVRKASPVGALFNASFGRAGASCADRGYSVGGGGDDPCTPGVAVSYRDAGGAAAFNASEARALAAYAARFDLDADTARRMVTCTCHPSSALLLNKRTHDPHRLECAALNASTTGSWVHRDPYRADYDGMLCDQGPFILATRSLSVLKSSPQLAMHLHDQIAPVPCSDRGYTQLYPPADHCYPPMHMYTQTPIEHDAGVLEAIAAEKRLTCNYTETPAACTTGFPAFAKAHQIAGDVAILNNNLGCNCLGRSTVGQQMARECWPASGQPAGAIPHSPVRDWWNG